MDDSLLKHVAAAIEQARVNPVTYETMALAATTTTLVWFEANGWAIVPRKATEAMRVAGREPVVSRDAIRSGGAIRAHLDQGGQPWTAAGELTKPAISKGDCAVMVWRAMVEAGEMDGLDKT